MRAVALTEPGRVETIEIPEPECGTHDVVVRVLGVGLCGTDMAIVRGSRPAPRYPWVLGHEGVGEVVATGQAVRDIHVGARVALEPNYCCLRCRACKNGFTSGCPERIAVGLSTPGVLAERVAVPAEFVHPVAAQVRTADLVCTEPLTVARAAIRRSGVTSDDRCLVVGAGSQGLFVCCALLAAGITPFVQEPHAGRRDLALSLGAVALDVADGYVDHVVETSGVPSALTSALELLVAGGTVTLIGMSADTVQLSSRTLVQRQWSLIGSLIYDHPGDFADTTAMLSAGEISPRRVLGAEFGLTEAAAAFAAVASTSGKVWINVGDAAA